MGKPGKKTQPRESAVDADDTSLDDTVRDSTVPQADLLSPQTCCSNCHTVFEVSLEQLSSADTRVRCGECLSIFDALANLRDGSDMDDTDVLIDSDGNIIEPDRPIGATSEHTDNDDSPDVFNSPDAGAASSAELSDDTSALDVTYSDFDLFSADAGLPEVAYFDQTGNGAQFDFDAVSEDENDETFSDTLFAQDATVDARSTLHDSGEADGLQNIALDNDVDFIADDSPRDAVIFNYRERETRIPRQPLLTDMERAGSALASSQEALVDKLDFNESPVAVNLDTALRIPEQRSRTWLYRSALFLLVICLAVGLYVYREQDNLQDNRLVRSVLDTGCRILGCELTPTIDLDALRVINRTVFSHPAIDNALIIRVAFVNEATFSQPYPVLEIRLTNINGGLVVKNNFQPIDYLDSWQAGDVLDAGKRLDISLTVEDPGQSAASFELDFR